MAERIPEPIIQEIIAANDIVELVGRYVQLKRSGASYVGLCPFHKEKTPSFHVTPDRQLYYCFGCNSGGNIVEFVKNIENLDFVEAVRFLAERANINISLSAFSKEDERLYEQKQMILKVNVEAARFFRDKLYEKEGEAALAYAQGRKLEPATMKTYGLGFAPNTWDSLTTYLLEKGYTKEQLVYAGVSSYTKTGKIIDRFINRLMFPIIDIRGNVIGFGGRIMDDGNVKYLNSPETPVFNKGKNLFSLNLAKSQRDLILVEGYMDVISLYQNGIKNAVASLGTALTSDQARLLARTAERVTLCYDTDEAGVKATKRTIEVFRGLDVKLRILTLPDGKDPDEFVKKYGAQKFTDCAARAETVAGYQLMLLRRQYDISDPGQKVEYVDACAKLLATVQSGVEREVLRARIAEETQIKAETIATETSKQVRKDERAERWNTTPKKEQRVARVPRSSTAEKLLSLLVADKRVLAKLRPQLKEDLFVNETHRKILAMLSETDDAATIVSRFAEEEASVAAAALCMPATYENSETAALDFIRALEKENYNYRVKKAVEAGDVEALNALLMAKNDMKEGGC